MCITPITLIDANSSALRQMVEVKRRAVSSFLVSLLTAAHLRSNYSTNISQQGLCWAVL